MPRASSQLRTGAIAVHGALAQTVASVTDPQIRSLTLISRSEPSAAVVGRTASEYKMNGFTPFNYLLAHRALLVGATYLLTALNYCFGLFALRTYEGQNFVIREHSSGVGRGSSPKVQMAFPFIPATFFSLSTFVLTEPVFVSFFLGGFFLLQLILLVFVVSNILQFRLLRDKTIAEGQIKYSARFRYRSYAAHIFSAAMVAAIAFALTYSPAFAGAALFGIGDALGALRRGARARSRAA